MEVVQHFLHITQLIVDAKKRAYQAVNHELVSLYWVIGKYLSEQVASSAWGKSIIKELAIFIANSEPNIKGFSPQNLWRMKQFYETYKDMPKLSALLREISWTHHTIIFSTAKTPEEREFYINLSIKEHLSYRELERQINSSYYERVMIGNAQTTSLPQNVSQNINNIFKDTYVLEMLQLPDSHAEKDIKKQISKNIGKF
jgi:predicted nuclease of restriction endonuclease-like (RecB) superfamily